MRRGCDGNPVVRGAGGRMRVRPHGSPWAHTRQFSVHPASLSLLSTIFDLAYCKEVEAMVTASRDSTVKVWEADWQIRMVFVGHRGALGHGGS